MTIALIALAAAVVMATIYFVVIGGSLGLVARRLDEDPELSSVVPDEKLGDDSLPVDVEY